MGLVEPNRGREMMIHGVHDIRLSQRCSGRTTIALFGLLDYIHSNPGAKAIFVVASMRMVDLIKARLAQIRADRGIWLTGKDPISVVSTLEVSSGRLRGIGRQTPIIYDHVIFEETAVENMKLAAKLTEYEQKIEELELALKVRKIP